MFRRILHHPPELLCVGGVGRHSQSDGPMDHRSSGCYPRRRPSGPAKTHRPRVVG
jgi:hypothetical protein